MIKDINGQELVPGNTIVYAVNSKRGDGFRIAKVNEVRFCQHKHQKHIFYKVRVFVNIFSFWRKKEEEFTMVLNFGTPTKQRKFLIVE